MSKKANHCDVCKHAEWYSEPRKGYVEDVFKCGKGHKPRFYQPNGSPITCSGWGYKRVCDDYEDDPNKVYKVSPW